MKARVLGSTWAGALLVSAAAMGGGDPADRQTSPRRIAPPTRIPDPLVAEPAGAAVQISAVPRAVRRAVVADASRRLSVDESAVVLVRAEQVTWSDGSLGCAERGRMYTQALVPGYRIVAKSGAAELVYHTDANGGVRTCAAFVPGAQGIHQQLNDRRVEPVTQRPAGAPRQ